MGLSRDTTHLSSTARLPTLTQPRKGLYTPPKRFGPNLNVLSTAYFHLLTCHLRFPSNNTEAIPLTQLVSSKFKKGVIACTLQNLFRMQEPTADAAAFHSFLTTIPYSPLLLVAKSHQEYVLIPIA
jgi:hypothetical protein